MLAFAIVCAAYAALVSIQNIVLSRRLEHWRLAHGKMREAYVKLWAAKARASGLDVQDDTYCPRGEIFIINPRNAGLPEEEVERLVGKARGGTSPKGAA